MTNDFLRDLPTYGGLPLGPDGIQPYVRRAHQLRSSEVRQQSRRLIDALHALWRRSLGGGAPAQRRAT